MNKFKKFLFFLLFIGANCLTAQVKIGENPNSINAASIIELESTTKAFVLTRVSNTQMENIAPLRGAMVYNTDAQCIFFYSGTKWYNLCKGGSSTTGGVGIQSTVDNGNGTFTFNYTDGTNFTTPNLKGAKGDTGTQGATGAKGETGAKGDTGAQGIQGVTGTKGLDGINGSTGAKGDTGATGIQGVTGAKGLDGINGTIGINGTTGDKGDTGAAGTNGTNGT
ncbi:collagen-like protein, partial [Sediminicola arcticus]